MPTNRQVADELYNSLLGNKKGAPKSAIARRMISDPTVQLKLTAMFSGLNEANRVRKETAKSSTHKGPSTKEEKLTPEQKTARSQTLLEKSGKTKRSHNKLFDILGDVGNVALDTLTLPGRVISGAAYRGSQALNQGEPVYSILDDMLYGAGRNALGKDKNTAADYLNETPAGEALANMPGGWQKRFLGITVPLLLDVATDPLTYLSLGSTTAMRGAVGTGKGGLMEGIGRIAEREIGDVAAYPNQILHNQKQILGKAKFDLTDKMNKIFGQVRGGARKGRVIGKDPTSIRNIAEDIASKAYSPQIETLDEAISRITKSNITRQKTKDAIKAQFPILHHWDDAVAEATRLGAKDVNAAAKEILQRKIADLADEMTERVYKEIQGSITTSPTLRFMGRDITTLPGNLHKLSTLSNDTQINRILKGLSYGKQFPGMTEQVAGKARAVSGNTFNEIQREVTNIAKGLSKQERKLIGQKVPLYGPLKAKQDQLIALYKRIFDEEQALGLRPGETFDPEYRYLKIKSKGGRYEDANKIQEFRRTTQTKIKSLMRRASKEKDPVKKAALLNEMAAAKNEITVGALQARVARRGATGFVNLEEDAIKNLMAKASKHVNKTQKARFEQGIADIYGIKGYLPPTPRQGLTPYDTAKIGLAGRGLQDVTHLARKTGFVPNELKHMGREYMYLDRNLKEIFDRFANIRGPLADEAIRAPAQMIDRFMSAWRKMQTIYSPAAFNTKAAISDAFFAFMDDIGPTDYARFWKSAWGDTLKILNGEGSSKVIRFKNGQSYRLEDLWKHYVENLGQGGLIHSDVPVGVSKWNIGTKLKNLSERREDFGRFVHFLGAMEDELTKVGSVQEALQGATYRVNKFKFDYGALTKFETGVKKYAIPFYTFPRKAIPTIAQSTATHPRTLATMSRIFSNEQADTDQLKGYLWPDFINRQGALALSGGKNPWALTSTGTPIETMTNLSNPLTQLGPLPNLVLEMASGRDTFTGREQDKNFQQLVVDALTPRLFREVTNLKRSNNPLASTLLSSLTGAKLYQVQDKWVESQQKGLESEFDDTLDKVDAKLKLIGYSIFRRHNGKVGIRDLNTNKIIMEFPDRQSANQAAQRLLTGG